MKKTIIIVTILTLGYTLFAQNTIDNVLIEVEKNNTALSAYRKSIDAEKIGNKTGLTLQNPQVELNFLWGNPTAIGNRSDFIIRQSFDFPTAYSYKNQISNLKNEQADLEYKKYRYDFLYQTRLVCIELTYLNALSAELNKRHTNALKIADAYKTKLSKGDVSVLEYNKTQINLLNISKDLESNEIQRNALLSNLATLNGGNAINFSDSQFLLHTIPADFEQWYTQAAANNPLLQWVKQEIAISEKQAKLNIAMSLPKFHGGFMNEKTTGQEFQGVTAGITIPLWENKNTVKYAKAKTIAMQSAEADAIVQFYNTTKAMHAKVIALQNNVNDYRSKLALYSNNELLEKAFNMGEISLTEYLFELSMYYENIYKLLEMEMDCSLAYAELNKYY